MDESQSPRTHCKRCGAEIAPSHVVCGLCGEPASRLKPTMEIDEPWLAPPPGLVDNPYQAPETLDEAPASALMVLLRIFLLLCGIGVFVLSVLIAFFAACLVAGGATNSFGIGILAGTIVASVVLVTGIRIMGRVFRRKPTTGTDR